jgi:hypothetical protein
MGRAPRYGRAVTAAHKRVLLALGLAALCTGIVISVAGAATTSTRYKVTAVTGVETLTATGATTTPTGVPAKYVLKATLTWKAKGAGQYGTTSLSTTPGAGQGRLCSGDCPTIGPLAGKLVVTGSVTPTDGKTPKIPCAVTKKLGQIFPKGSTSTYRTVEFYKKGSKYYASIDTAQLDYIIQQSVKNPSCKEYGASTGYVQIPFSKSRIGAATITVSFNDSKKLTLGTPVGAKATFAHHIKATLKRY